MSYSDHLFNGNHRSRQCPSPPKKALWVIFTSSLFLSPKSPTLFLPHITNMIIYLLPLPSIVNPQLRIYSGAQNFISLCCPQFFMSCSMGVKCEEMIIKYTWHDCAERSFVKKKRRVAQLSWTSTNLSETHFLVTWTIASRNRRKVSSWWSTVFCKCSGRSQTGHAMAPPGVSNLKSCVQLSHWTFPIIWKSH